MKIKIIYVDIGPWYENRSTDHITVVTDLCHYRMKDYPFPQSFAFDLPKDLTSDYLAENFPDVQIEVRPTLHCPTCHSKNPHLTVPNQKEGEAGV